MLEERSRQLRLVTPLLDAGLTGVTFLASYSLRTILLGADPADLPAHLALLPLVILLWVPSLAISGAYRSPRTTPRLIYMWAVIRGVATALGLILGILFILKIRYISRAVIAVFGVLDALVLICVRVGIGWYFQRALRRGENHQKVLIIGSGKRARHLGETLLQNSKWGIDIVGYLDPDPARVDTELPGAPVLGSVDEITSVLKEHVIDEVIVAVPRTMLSDVDKVAFACEEEGIKIRFMADIFDIQIARATLVEFGAIPLLTLEPVARQDWELIVKRIIDVGVMVALVPLLLPVAALVAVAIKLDSRGPIFFIQHRVGINKRRFRMLKFRTMVDGAAQMQAQLESINEAEGPIFKIKNDPRITRVGRFLRRTSLDELPQIFHVITGKMSLVGPRPMSVRDVDLFDRGIQRKRFSVKPGLTCLWQISGRSHLPFSRWLELDLHYIEHWSLALDIKILLKTIPVVLRGTGAV